MSKPLANIYFFYGDDVSALHERLKIWKTRFAEKSDGMLDAEDHHEPLDLDRVTRSLQLQALLGPKRLVTIFGAMSESAKVQEAVAGLLQSVSDQTVVIFVEEGEVSGKSVLAWLLLDQANVTHFPAVSISTLRNQITKTFTKHDIAIDPDALSMLSERLIGDSLRAKQEIEKLVLLGTSPITREMVETIVTAPLESRIFALTDLVLHQKVDQAYQVLENEIEFGTAPMQLLGLLTSQVRRIIATRDLLDRGADFSSSTFFRKSKPYTITVAKQHAKRLNMRQLIRYYERLCLADLYIKTGADPLYVLTSVMRIN